MIRLLPIRLIPALTFRAWLTPPPIGKRTLERDNQATSDLQSFQVGDITGYEIGSGPLILAVHGWGGRPAQMAVLGRTLAALGFRVVMPEMPGHAGGEVTDIKTAASALRQLIDDVGMPDTIIGHSFASMVFRLAFFDDEPPAQIVLVSPALDVNDALDTFGDRLRLFPWARSGLRQRLEQWDPQLWPVLSVLRPEQFAGSSMEIFHDPNDDDTSFARSAELAALRPHTRLHVVDDLGHWRLLADPGVVSQVASVIAGSPVDSSAS